MVQDMDLGADKVELLAEELGLRVEEGDDAEAAMDGVAVTGVCLVEDRLHGVVALGGVHLLQDAERVAHPVELVDVEELLGLVGREVRGQRALGGALAPLEFASGTCLCPAPRVIAGGGDGCAPAASSSSSAIARTARAYAPLLLMILLVHSGGVAARYGPCTACGSTAAATVMNTHSSLISPKPVLISQSQSFTDFPFLNPSHFTLIFNHNPTLKKILFCNHNPSSH